MLFSGPYFFSADFGLKIFLYYSIAYDISVLEYIGVSLNYKCSVSIASAGFFVLLPQSFFRLEKGIILYI